MSNLPVDVTLIRSGAELTDNEINAAQRIIAADTHCGGLQDTLLGNMYVIYFFHNCFNMYVCFDIRIAL